MDLLNVLWLLFDFWFNMFNVLNVLNVLNVVNCSLDLFLRLMVLFNRCDYLFMVFNFLVSYFNFNWSLCGHSAAEVLRSIGKLAELCLDLIVLLGNQRIFLLLKDDA